MTKEPKKKTTEWLKTELCTVGGAAKFLLYGLAIFLALVYIRSLFVNAAYIRLIFFIDLVKVVLVLFLLLMFFRLIHLACRRACSGGEKAKSFPSHATIFVGIWLVLLSALSVLGLYVAFLPKALQGLLCPLDDGTVPQIMESLVMMFAAGVGSCISTILGYLLHASQEKDFDVAYIPWYFARPLMGMLLGLIFYFVLKGGLLVLTVGEPGSGTGGLNLWSLAAVGALVGLFSKNAIEKLREVFNTLFRTQRDFNHELLRRLPKELQKQVSPYLEGTGEEANKPPKAGEQPEAEKQPKAETPPAKEHPEAEKKPEAEAQPEEGAQTEAETPPGAGRQPETGTKPDADTQPKEETPPDRETPEPPGSE